ncbi:hypothetical protein [Nocardia abscessus]|uniref:hypothetical protein n=1 Tax=Nocardia abscessus TaxID=120957 RepID=UPI0024577D23|nr:hypothetical protein [Nocardia abscessus]
MFSRTADGLRRGALTIGITAAIKRILPAWLFVLGATAALTIAGTVPASAVPPSSVDLQTEWGVHQRLSGTDDNPIGFKVKVTWRETNAANTIMSFNGVANTLTYSGEVVDGRIQGRLIRYTIRWSDGKTGVYQGTWFDDGYLRGNAQEIGTGRTAEWWSQYNNWRLTPAA